VDVAPPHSSKQLRVPPSTTQISPPTPTPQTRTPPHKPQPHKPQPLNPNPSNPIPTPTPQGAGLASMEALRPQAVMTLCEILHHCRKSLSLEQLGRVVRLMTAYIVDQVGLGVGVGVGWGGVGRGISCGLEGWVGVGVGMGFGGGLLFVSQGWGAVLRLTVVEVSVVSFWFLSSRKLCSFGTATVQKRTLKPQRPLK